MCLLHTTLSGSERVNLNESDSISFDSRALLAYISLKQIKVTARLKHFIMDTFWIAHVFLCLSMTGSEIAGKTPNSSRNQVLKIGFIWPISNTSLSIPAAFQIGVTKSKLLLPEYDIQYIIEDTSCNAKIGMKAIIKLKNELHGLDGIIGSQCSVVCEPVALLTAAWNIP